MSEPENALCNNEDKPPASACACDSLKEKVEALESRLDHVEQELALLCGKGLLSRIGRKLALE